MPNSGFNADTAQSDEWQTPQWLFDALDAEFSFTLDGAATPENTKCKRFCTANVDLAWGGERVFCNPPYSNIEPFINKAKYAQIAVFLLPVRTDSDWFRKLIELGCELRWFRKRIRFLQRGEPMDSPRFASLVAILK